MPDDAEAKKPDESNSPGGSGGGSESGAPSAFDVISSYLHPGRDNVMLIYILYLAGLIPAFGAVPIVIGFILALLNRSSADGVWASHYEYQYRQAAMALLFIIVSAILIFIFIGVIGFVLTAIWWIVRSVKGLQAASRQEAIADPKSWSW